MNKLFFFYITFHILKNVVLFLLCVPICVCDLCICVCMCTCSCLCKLHTSVFVSSIASTWALCVCVLLCVFVRIGRPRPLLRLAAELVWLPVHIPAPAVTPLCDSKSRRGADRLAARKVKITILLLKMAYIVALQVHLFVPAPWLSAYSQTPNARAVSPPPVAPVLWCCGSCLLRRMHVYCLSDILSWLTETRGRWWLHRQLQNMGMLAYHLCLYSNGFC